MNTDPIQIEHLARPPSEADLRELASLLADAVNSGAAVSFLAPLTEAVATDWWRKTIATAADGTVILVARDADGICGTVQMHPSWAPNQPHRADIAKLIVHTRCRGTGIGRRLMVSIEDTAREAGFTLLTLDTKLGCVAEQLYRRLGWTCVGSIPKYALDPDGTAFHSNAIFYKLIAHHA